MKYKFNFASIFALLIVVLSLGLTACASNPNVKKFSYQAYNVVTKEKSGINTFYIKDDANGASVWYESGMGMFKCFNTEQKAVKTETDTHLIYVVEPKLAGCERLRYIVKKDGSQVVTQTAIGDKWSKGGVSMRSD